MGRHDRDRTQLPDRPMVGRGRAGTGDLRGQPGFQPARRRPARRARSESRQMSAPLLEVEDLRVRFHLRTGIVEAVRGVSFQLGRERLGIVGESGSGKSQTGRAILGLTPPPGKVAAKRLAFDGIDLLTASKRRLRTLRGSRISMVMQDPKYSLNPVMTIGEQIVEAYQAHRKASHAEARDKTLHMLEAVKMRDPSRVFSLYPHEVSGGM